MMKDDYGNDPNIYFSCSSEEIWEKLQSFSSLQYVAAPYAKFEPLDKIQDFKWKKGQTFEVYFKVFGLIPFGVHTIKIISFDEDKLTIYSNEQNSHVELWNHRVELIPIDQGQTSYTDQVEIGAGWKTPFVYLWARLFYSHRQKKWIKLLNKK